jgi:hypothetical protein
VVCGEVCCGVWVSLVAGAPVAECCAVLVDEGFASGLVGFPVDLGGCGGPAVAFVVPFMFGASWSVLEVGASGLVAHP